MWCKHRVLSSRLLSAWIFKHSQSCSFLESFWCLLPPLEVCAISNRWMRTLSRYSSRDTPFAWLPTSSSTTHLKDTPTDWEFPSGWETEEWASTEAIGQVGPGLGLKRLWEHRCGCHWVASGQLQPHTQQTPASTPAVSSSTRTCSARASASPVSTQGGSAGQGEQDHYRQQAEQEQHWSQQHHTISQHAGGRQFKLHLSLFRAFPSRLPRGLAAAFNCMSPLQVACR